LVGSLAFMGQMNTYGILFTKCETRRKLGRYSRTWKNNIKIHLKNTEYDDRNCIKLAQNKVKKDLEYAAKNHRVS
jgi:hypothetical protein